MNCTSTIKMPTDTDHGYKKQNYDHNTDLGVTFHHFTNANGNKKINPIFKDNNQPFYFARFTKRNSIN